VNLVPGADIPNLAVVRASSSGEVCVFASAPTDVVVDTFGTFPTTGSFVPVVPERLLETRPAEGQKGYSGAKPGPGQVVALQVTGRGAAAIPATAGAVVLNVTGTEATADGFVTVWPCDQARPEASSLNLRAGGTRANLVVAKLSADGRVCLYTQSGAHLLADVAGWFPSSSQFTSVTPERLLDTRSGLGGAKPGAGGVVTLRVVGVGNTNVPANASAVVLNVTATDASAPGYVQAYPCGGERPATSNLNVVPGVTAPNAVIARLDATGSVCLYSYSDTHLVVDISGWFAAPG
jgi:hypothetical protein